MLKTVKGKVIVGTVAVGLLSGAGVALGTSGAGSNFKNWIDKRTEQKLKFKNRKLQPFGKGKI